MHQFIFVTVDEAAKCCVGKRIRVCFLMMVKKRRGSADKLWIKF